ncbi:MAG TPA: RNA polymerase sigma factor [Terriglobales bacterium]|jgi:RNA polymerase sigma-70 factor (ECF subfamily)|nr:RNA polymerase sigma factor [Terriglobales bacterium]
MNLHLAAPASRSVDESRAKNGPRMEESAFRLFYEQTSTPLLRYLLGATRKRDVAEDLLQETYCRFLTTDVPEMEEREARSYLFRIATNLMHDRWRHAREDSLPERSVPDVSPAPQFERRLSVRQAFERLKPRERQLLWLAYVEGSNHCEIADCTGLRAGSVRLLLFRARHKLAELIGKSPQRTDVGVHK